ncbi:MAG: hypothetical protein EOO54_23020, partial [Haliea sp.]
MNTTTHPTSPPSSGRRRARIHPITACLIAGLLMQPPPGLAQTAGVDNAPPAATSSNDAVLPASAAIHADRADPSAAAAPDTSPTPLKLPLDVHYSAIGADGSRNKDITAQLRVVHLQATQNLVAQQVAINAALMLLSGGLALGIHTFGKETLLGDAPEAPIQPDSLQNPGLQKLPADLARRAASWLSSQPALQGKTFSRPLFVSIPSWRLVYNSWDAGDATYRLKFDADIY